MAEHGAGQEARVTKAPWRLRAALAAGTFLASRNVETIGCRRLRALYENRPVVVAVTHLTDIDMQLAAAVISRHRGVEGTRTSRLDHPLKYPVAWTELWLAGRKHFQVIDGNRFKDLRSPTLERFNPRHLDRTVRAARAGKAVLIAAHRPADDRKRAEAGIAVPYVAAATNAVILPVAVRIMGSDNVGMRDNAMGTLFERAPAEVIIGEPFEMPECPGLETCLAGDREAFLGAVRHLRDQGAFVVGALNTMLDLAEQQTIARTPMFHGSIVGEV